MKFLFPLIINDPVGKNYPVGADFDTCSGYTHQAPEIILVSQAFDRQTVKTAAYSNVFVGTIIFFFNDFITVDAAPP
jgi:hypothetical protein